MPVLAGVAVRGHAFPMHLGVDPVSEKRPVVHPDLGLSVVIGVQAHVAVGVAPIKGGSGLRLQGPAVDLGMAAPFYVHVQLVFPCAHRSRTQAEK